MKSNGACFLKIPKLDQLQAAQIPSNPSNPLPLPGLDPFQIHMTPFWSQMIMAIHLIWSYGPELTSPFPYICPNTPNPIEALNFLFCQILSNPSCLPPPLPVHNPKSTQTPTIQSLYHLPMTIPLLIFAKNSLNLSNFKSQNQTLAAMQSVFMTSNNPSSFMVETHISRKLFTRDVHWCEFHPISRKSRFS